MGFILLGCAESITIGMLVLLIIRGKASLSYKFRQTHLFVDNFNQGREELFQFNFLERDLSSLG